MVSDREFPEGLHCGSCDCSAPSPYGSDDDDWPDPGDGEDDGPLRVGGGDLRT